MSWCGTMHARMQSHYARTLHALPSLRPACSSLLCPLRYCLLIHGIRRTCVSFSQSVNLWLVWYCGADYTHNSCRVPANREIAQSRHALALNNNTKLSHIYMEGIQMPYTSSMGHKEQQPYIPASNSISCLLASYCLLKHRIRDTCVSFHTGRSWTYGGTYLAVSPLAFWLV